jgi:hypothetical protein
LERFFALASFLGTITPKKLANNAQPPTKQDQPKPTGIGFTGHGHSDGYPADRVAAYEFIR